MVNEIQSIVEHYTGPEEIHIVGDAYLLHYTEHAMKRDLRNLVPFVVLVIAATLYFTFRSFLGGLGTHAYGGCCPDLDGGGS